MHLKIIEFIICLLVTSLSLKCNLVSCAVFQSKKTVVTIGGKETEVYAYQLVTSKALSGGTISETLQTSQNSSVVSVNYSSVTITPNRRNFTFTKINDCYDHQFDKMVVQFKCEAFTFRKWVGNCPPGYDISSRQVKRQSNADELSFFLTNNGKNYDPAGFSYRFCMKGQDMINYTLYKQDEHKLDLDSSVSVNITASNLNQTVDLNKVSGIWETESAPSPNAYLNNKDSDYYLVKMQKTEETYLCQRDMFNNYWDKSGTTNYGQRCHTIVPPYTSSFLTNGPEPYPKSCISDQYWYSECDPSDCEVFYKLAGSSRSYGKSPPVTFFYNNCAFDYFDTGPGHPNGYQILSSFPSLGSSDLAANCKPLSTNRIANNQVCENNNSPYCYLFDTTSNPGGILIISTSVSSLKGYFYNPLIFTSSSINVVCEILLPSCVRTSQITNSTKDQTTARVSAITSPGCIINVLYKDQNLSLTSGSTVTVMDISTLTETEIILQTNTSGPVVCQRIYALKSGATSRYENEGVQPAFLGDLAKKNEKRVNESDIGTELLNGAKAAGQFIKDNVPNVLCIIGFFSFLCWFLIFWTFWTLISVVGGVLFGLGVGYLICPCFFSDLKLGVKIIGIFTAVMVIVVLLVQGFSKFEQIGAIMAVLGVIALAIKCCRNRKKKKSQIHPSDLEATLASSRMAKLQKIKKSLATYKQSDIDSDEQEPESESDDEDEENYKYVKVPIKQSQSRIKQTARQKASVPNKASKFSLKNVKDRKSNQIPDSRVVKKKNIKALFFQRK